MNPLKNTSTQILIFLLFIMSIKTNGQEKVAKYEVKSVMLFSNQAQIYTSSKISFEPGINEIIFENLPPNIQKESLQLSIGSEVQVISIQCINNVNNEIGNENPKVQGLKDSLRKYGDLLAYTKIKKFALDEEEKLILSNKILSGDKNGGTSVEVEDMAQLYRTRLIELKEDSYDLTFKVDKLSKKTFYFQTELDKLNRDNPIEKSKVILKLNAKKRIVIPVDLSFLSFDAGWTPSYDIKSEGIGSNIQLIYKANIFQATGMDWNSIKLSLNTGNPSENGNKPELSPWNLNFEDPQMEDKMYSKLSLRSTATYEATSDLTVNQIETDLARNFELNQLINIPSSRDLNSIEIETYILEANYEIVTTPKLDQSAFVIADLKSWEKLGLIPAMVNIYFDGSYTGQGFIDPLTTEKNLKISLGKDKNIIIKREKLREFSADNFMGGKKTVTYEYQINIKNTRKEDIEISVEDQIPVSQNKEIEIKLTEAGGSKVEEATGKLNWKIKISGAADKKLNFAFEVKYPKDKIISNL